MLDKPVRLSTFILVTLGMLDLVSTLILMQHGLREANPIFNGLARMTGSTGFVGGKLLFLVGPVLLLELVRQRNPKSAEQGTWLAIAFYALFYFAHMIAYYR